MRQHTLSKSWEFSGKGLHTGTFSTMKVGPAPENTGIVFHRMDLGDVPVHALAENVTSTARSTTIGEGNAEVHTIEHIMSALTGMGIDNARIDLDNLEVPILDGSARFYAEAFAKDGLVEQSTDRKYITVPEPVEIRDGKSGSWVRIEPAERLSFESTVNFDSSVLGVQKASWDEGMDYGKELAVCRTFVFFHEIEYLLSNNLIKGGDTDNALIVVEHPVSQQQLDDMASAMGRPRLHVTPEGYLSNAELNFPNEIGRHKLLDLIGDIRLCGGFLSAKVTAYKPGHTINTNCAKAFRKLVK